MERIKPLINLKEKLPKFTLYDVNKALDEHIVGDYQPRMSLFTNWILAEKQVIVTGSRSSGKTFITDHISNLLGNNCYTINKGSDKVGWYQVDEITNSKYVKVLEYNQLPKDFQETLKHWGEGKDSNYSVTETNAYTGKRGVRKINLPRKPYVLCLADENEASLGDELRSRLIEIRTDSSMQQNQRVIDYQADIAIKPYNTRKIDITKLNQLKQHVNGLPPFNTFEYKHPAANIFTNAIPTFFSDSRREFPKYLDNTSGITRFYYKDRIRINIEKHKKPILLITPEDMLQNHIIFGKTLIDSSLKCNSLEREMLEIFSKQNSELPRNYIQQELRKKGVNLSANMVTKHLNKLSDVGYLDKQKLSTQVTYQISDFIADFKLNIDWNKVISESNKNVKKYYSEYYKEYKSKFGNKDVSIINPLNGKQIKIIDWNDSKGLNPLNNEKIEIKKENKYINYDEENILENEISEI